MHLPFTSGILPIYEGTGFLFACSFTRLLYSAFWFVKSMKASACAGLLGFGSFNKSCAQDIITIGSYMLTRMLCIPFHIARLHQKPARHIQSNLCMPNEPAQIG